MWAEEILVKDEPVWETARVPVGLYADHEVKEDLVLGPEQIQWPGDALSLDSKINEEENVKQETPQDLTEAGKINEEENVKEEEIQDLTEADSANVTENIEVNSNLNRCLKTYSRVATRKIEPCSKSVTSSDTNLNNVTKNLNYIREDISNEVSYPNNLETYSTKVTFDPKTQAKQVTTNFNACSTEVTKNSKTKIEQIVKILEAYSIQVTKIPSKHVTKNLEACSTSTEVNKNSKTQPKQSNMRLKAYYTEVPHNSKIQLTQVTKYLKDNSIEVANNSKSQPKQVNINLEAHSTEVPKNSKTQLTEVTKYLEAFSTKITKYPKSQSNQATINLESNSTEVTKNFKTQLKKVTKKKACFKKEASSKTHKKIVTNNLEIHSKGVIKKSKTCPNEMTKNLKSTVEMIKGPNINSQATDMNGYVWIVTKNLKTYSRNVTKKLPLNNVNDNYSKEKVDESGKVKDSEDVNVKNVVKTKVTDIPTGENVEKSKDKTKISVEKFEDENFTVKNYLFPNEECKMSKNPLNQLAQVCVVQLERISLKNTKQSSKSESVFKQRFEKRNVYKDKKKYQCDGCDKQFLTKSVLNIHALTHMRSFLCRLCNKCFMNIDSYKMHVRYHNMKNPFHCETCDKFFIRQINWRNHVESHKEGICNTKEHIRKSGLARHLRTHMEKTNEAVFPCNICNKKYKTQANLTIHKQSHSSEEIFKCETCERRFKSLCDYTRHQRDHERKKHFKCDICFKQFERKAVMLRHRRTHSGEKPFRCEICNKGFSDSSGLGQHKLCHTGRKQFICNVCGKRFLTNFRLAVHLRYHTVDECHSCNICNKRFRDITTLISHAEIHFDKFTCDICEKEFKVKRCLMLHLKVAHIDRSYCCDICKKEFSRKIYLVKHQVVHSNRKLYQCRYCKKQFKHNDNLKRHHQITHSDARPFTCEVCKKRFKEKCTFMRHQRMHTREKP